MFAAPEHNWLTNIAGGIGYVAVALLVIRPLLARWARGVEARGEL